MCRGHFKQQNHQEKAQKCKKSDIKLTMTRTLAYNRELKQKGRGASPCSISAETMCVGGLKFFATLYMPINDHKSTSSIDFGVKHNPNQANSQIQNPQIMRSDCIYQPYFLLS